MPRIGPLGRSMLICQPPSKEAELRANCCNKAVYRVTISSVTGLTVGDIVDAAHQLRAVHRLCPLAHINQLDEDGYVKVQIYIHARVDIGSEDPYFSGQREREKQEDAARQGGEDRFGRYVVAKKAGQYLTKSSYETI